LMAYCIVDRVLVMLEEKQSPERIEEVLSISEEQLESVLRRIESNEHKRKVPPVPELP
jgi:NAD+ synthase